MVAACASSGSFIADNLYEEPPSRAAVAGRAAEVFERWPWEQRITPSGLVRYHQEAQVRLPDSAESFHLREIAVYTTDGRDVELEYQSFLPGDLPDARALIRVAVYQAPVDLETEWTSYARRWHERQAGTLTEPLPLPGDYPAETKQSAWLLPVGDGYDAPAFEQRVLFHNGPWAVRYQIACPAQARDAAAPRIVAFLRWMRAVPSGGSSSSEAGWEGP